jgi:hypothetical protein
MLIFFIYKACLLLKPAGALNLDFAYVYQANQLYSYRPLNEKQSYFLRVEFSQIAINNCTMKAALSVKFF